MGDDALIPMRLFGNRQFSQGLIVNVLIGLAMFGALATLPLYLQLVKGATPTQSGLWLLPMMVGLMGGSISSGIITGRTGRYKIFPVVGTVLLIIAFGMMLALIRVDTPYPVLAGTFLVLGAGLGLNMQTMMMAVQNTVSARDIGVATSSATFFRATGGTIGTAVFLSLLFNNLPTNVATQVQAAASTPAFQQALAGSGLSPQQYQAQLAGLSEDSAFLSTLPTPLATPIQQGFVNSTQVVYILAGIVAVLAFLLVLLLKEVPLRTKSALQEIQEEDAANAAAAAGDVALNDTAGTERQREADLVSAGSVPGVDQASGGRHRRN
jgi:hypothetical protein